MCPLPAFRPPAQRAAEGAISLRVLYHLQRLYPWPRLPFSRVTTRHMPIDPIKMPRQHRLCQRFLSQRVLHILTKTLLRLRPQRARARTRARLRPFRLRRRSLHRLIFPPHHQADCQRNVEVTALRTPSPQDPRQHLLCPSRAQSQSQQSPLKASLVCATLSLTKLWKPCHQVLRWFQML